MVSKMTSAPGRVVEADRTELAELIERARRGDESCLPALRRMLTRPGMLEWLAEEYGNPHEWLLNSLNGVFGVKNLLAPQALRAKIAQTQRELEGPDPSPLERLLAQRAAVCWFLVCLEETRGQVAKATTPDRDLFHQRRIDAAHRRFLSACRTLAQVRKLAIPNLVQVNAENAQINVDHRSRITPGGV